MFVPALQAGVRCVNITAVETEWGGQDSAQGWLAWQEALTAGWVLAIRNSGQHA